MQRKHFKHSSRSISRGTSDNRRYSIGSHSLPDARGSVRTLSHHSVGAGHSRGRSEVGIAAIRPVGIEIHEQFRHHEMLIHIVSVRTHCSFPQSPSGES
jgi:hypothetical protein